MADNRTAAIEFAHGNKKRYKVGEKELIYLEEIQVEGYLYGWQRNKK